MERICKHCGMPLDDFDMACCEPIQYTYGYGSNYDGAKLKLDLCSNCLDELSNYLIRWCVIDPIED